MNSDFSYDDATPLNRSSLRESLLQLADQIAATESVATQQQRVAVLQQLFGTAICRRVGIYTLPKDFLLSVVIPVYNEANTIQRVVRRVRNTHLPLEIILVDDCSSDGSREVLQQIAHEDDVTLLMHETNQGKGAALKTGFAHATGDVVVIQDADMEYDPDDFHILLQPIVEDRADVVYGSRFNSPDRDASPLWHMWANETITTLCSLALGRRFTDVETCYKLIRRELLEKIAPTLRENRFGIEIEITCKLAKLKGVRFYERPIRYDRRSYAEGKKIGWRDGIAALWCILRYAMGR